MVSTRRRRQTKRRGSKKCGKGYIRRRAYTRKSRSGKRVRVTARCIKDRGLPGKGYQGKGPGIGKLREGEL